MVTYLSFVEFILFSWTSLFFGYSFNEAYHTSECQVHSEDKLLLFSAFSARHCYGIWVSFISRNYVIGFSTSKDNSLCVFILWRPHGNQLIFRSLKIRHVLIFLAGSSSISDMVGGSASPLTHTWLIESKILTCLTYLVMIERVGKRDSLSHCHYPVILADNYCQLTVKCIRVSYFLVTVVIRKY